jgi:atypical dual specificity phosphatase
LTAARGHALPPALRRTCWWAVDGRLLAGPHPLTSERRLFDSLLDLGVRAFVDLTEKGETGTRDYATVARRAADGRAAETSFTRMAIADMGTPGSRRAREIVGLLADGVKAGETTYVHCREGIGRTGMVVALLLVELGATPAQALEELDRRRRGTVWADRRSPETDAQIALVSSWGTDRPLSVGG